MISIFHCKIIDRENGGQIFWLIRKQGTRFVMTDLVDHMAMMREKAREAAEKKKRNKQSRQANMRNVHMQMKNEMIRRLREENEELHLTVEQLRHIIQENDIPLSEPDLHMIALPTPRKVGRPGYDSQILEFAQIIHTAAPRVLEILRQFPDIIPNLPSERTLQRIYGDATKLRMQELQELSSIPHILRSWRERHQIPKGLTVPCVLSVDAIHFKPFVQVTPEGEVIGIDWSKLDSKMTGKRLYELMQNDLPGWQKWLEDHTSCILSSAFVYYLQPLDPDVPCVVLHWQESTSGKATELELENLLEVTYILQKWRIKVVATASDGDPTYDLLHNGYLRSYAKPAGGLLEMKELTQSTKHRPMICDPLHLLKRLRYRLLSGKVFTSGFDGDGPLFDSKMLQQRRCFTDVPDVVFMNDRTTKMHDSLPLALFTVNVFLQALKIDSVLAAYLLPGVLLNTALSNENVTRQERIELLTIGYYYMVQYHYYSEECIGEGVVRRGNHEVNILFDRQLTMHLLNDFRALVFILTKYPEMPISLNRLGSNPLEHCFGVLRTQAGANEYMYHGLRTLAVNQLCGDMTPIRVAKRSAAYGCRLDPEDPEQEFDLFVDSSNEVADALFKALNLSYLLRPNNFRERVCGSFETILTSLAVDYSCRGTKHLTMRKVTLGAGTSFKGRDLTRAKSESGSILGMSRLRDAEERVDWERGNDTSGKLEAAQLKPKRKRANEIGEPPEEYRSVLNALMKSELIEIADAIMSEAEEVVSPCSKRTKSAIIDWITAPGQWSKARGVVRNFFECRATGR